MNEFLGSVLAQLMTGAYVSHAAVEFQSASQLRKGDGWSGETKRGKRTQTEKY